jgi:hypothetical protein
MDLFDLAYEDVAVMDIKGHDGKILVDEAGKTSTIEVFGPDSDEKMRAQTKYRKALISAGGDPDMSIDAMCRLLSDCTKSIKNVTFKGKPATVKQAFSLYKEVTMVREQVDTFLGTKGNFTKSGAKS